MVEIWQAASGSTNSNDVIAARREKPRQSTGATTGQVSSRDVKCRRSIRRHDYSAAGGQRHGSVVAVSYSINTIRRCPALDPGLPVINSTSLGLPPAVVLQTADEIADTRSPWPSIRRYHDGNARSGAPKGSTVRQTGRRCSIARVAQMPFSHPVAAAPLEEGTGLCEHGLVNVFAQV